MRETNEPMELMILLKDIVAGLDECVQALATSFSLPHRVEINGMLAFRHAEKDDLLLSFLKLVKIASHHNAAIVLLSRGYVQEVYALCRMIDEACEDIHFMATPLGDSNEPSPNQLRFFEEFFQEEFSGTDLLQSHQPRDRVPRKKVRAGISKIGNSNIKHDTSRELEIGGVLSGTFSGFVHGAYVHIMELFGGDPAHFHTRGMLETPRLQEGLDNHVSYVYRSLLAVEHVGHRASREDIVYRALDLNIVLALRTSCVSIDSITRMQARRARPLNPSS